ncbi:RNA-guided endonuclease IscB [Haloactinospora alba]|uniref:RNA-guided endonuclease IscB n=1 Tax=Haloactinospora alba TaxID=405555 RepID=UPI001FE8DE12|nr:RNA-guided endonuclease IscB [Haloactinospora alba]
MEHVREETPGAAPGAGGATPAPSGVGEQPRERHPCVMVLDAHHRPLQPCHPARARTLLAKGRAVVHRRVPFTIRLKDRTVAESDVDGVEVGVDPGSKHTGLAVFTAQGGQRRGRFALRLDHRGAQIRKKMGQRSAYRSRRRTANVRYRAPRFNNRARAEEWLPPSLRHRVDTTVSWVVRLSRWAPVRQVHVERVAFDTHALSAGHPLEGREYQRGTLHGYEVREYLLAKFGRACVYCWAVHTPLNVDHVHPKSRGGSDRVSNLVLACIRCNQTKGEKPVEEFAPAAAPHILARAKTPLRDAAAVQSSRWALWRALDARLPVRTGSGGRTKYNRTRNHLPKTHTLDALCVGETGAVAEVVNRMLVAACTGRGTHARTRCDKHGFPRLRLPRTKTFFGYQTGDLVRAVVPAGKKAGTHSGRVAVRAKGVFNITTVHGTAKDIHHRYVRLLQRADGYAYTMRKEEAASSPA